MHFLNPKPYLLFLAGAALLLNACNTLPPSAMDPVNKVVNTGLPPLDSAPSSDLSLFSFRIITPVENVDLFSILFKPSDQNTLPVAQLKEVQIAKERIQNAQILTPQEANVIGMHIARYYSWDVEVARQAVLEVMDTYVQRRDAERAHLREMANQRFTYYAAQNDKKAAEYNKQAAAVQEKLFGDLPEPKPMTQAEQEANRQRYFDYMERKRQQLLRAQAEYNKQAEAAHQRFLQTLEEARKKSEAQAARRRAVLLGQTQAVVNAKAKTQALEEPQPYTLYSLANGDFMLDAYQAMPAVIQLQVDQFDQPIAVPILPQTSHGRLLISINRDQDGNPLVYGGLDASAGFAFDMTQPVFSVSYVNQRQILEFIYPDGKVEQYDIASLQDLTAADAMQNLQPTLPEIDPATLAQKRDVLAGIHYQFTPELDYMEPDQAMDMLNAIQNNL